MVLSKLRVKAISPPASTPGIAIGRVMSRNRSQRVAPRSAAASSNCSLMPAIRARTMNVTTARLNIACDTTSLTRPLLNIAICASTPRVTNHGRYAIPSTTSGVISEIANSATSPTVMRVARLARAKAIPPSVPRIVASRADKNAACKLVITDETITSLLIALTYASNPNSRN